MPSNTHKTFLFSKIDEVTRNGYFPIKALCFADEVEVTNSLLRKRILMLQSAGLVVDKSDSSLIMLTHAEHDCHSDMPEDAKRLHRMTAMRMLGQERTTEEEQLLLKMEKMEKMEEEAKEVERVMKGTEKSPLLNSRHPQLPVFTSSVKLQSQAGRGRFLVAAKDISPGNW